MKDTTGGWNPQEYEKKKAKRDLGLILLLGALVLGADYIDYRNSFKDDGLNEVYVLDDEENEVVEDTISYEENHLNYPIHRDPFLPSEDSDSFIRRIIKNDNLVRKLKKKR